jgi:hypothetical protein
MTWSRDRKRYEGVRADHVVIAEAAVAPRHDARMASYFDLNK